MSISKRRNRLSTPNCEAGLECRVMLSGSVAGESGTSATSRASIVEADPSEGATAFSSGSTSRSGQANSFSRVSVIPRRAPGTTSNSEAKASAIGINGGGGESEATVQLGSTPSESTTDSISSSFARRGGVGAAEAEAINFFGFGLQLFGSNSDSFSVSDERGR